MSILLDIVILAGCYIAGAIPSGLLIGRQAGMDIREHGSKNIGMTNVWRVLGWRYGLATLLADVGKAFAAVSAAPLIAPAVLPAFAVLAGAAVLLGNFFNCFLKFKGGKGVAASLGVFLALAPVVVLIVLAVFTAIVGATRYISLGSICAAALLPILVYTFHGFGPLFVMVLGISVLVIVKHRANIGRLLSGTESKFGGKKS